MCRNMYVYVYGERARKRQRCIFWAHLTDTVTAVCKTLSRLWWEAWELRVAARVKQYSKRRSV